MVEILLTAKTPAGEAAIRTYAAEELSLKQKLEAKAYGIMYERKIISEKPLVHSTKIILKGKHLATFNARFSIWKDNNDALYKFKLTEYGAEDGDYTMETLQ